MVISIVAICMILGLLALLLALSGRFYAATVLLIVAFVLFLVHVGGYL